MKGDTTIFLSSPAQPDLGGWIQTASGGRFYPLNPRVQDINIEDIAAALSKVCRFSGHCSGFYSVAEHSVLVKTLLSGRTDDPDILMWGLMHDASEAYIADIASPLKQQPGFKFYRDMELGVMQAVCTRFGLDPAEPPVVKECDQLALAIEARDLMPHREAKAWSWLPKPPGSFSALCWDPAKAKYKFLEHYNHLESLRV